MAYIKERTITKEFTFDYATVTAQGKPTRVTRGASEAWSLPIYDSDDEELFTCSCIPYDWNGVDNITFILGGWLTNANTDKNFNLQVSVDCYGHGDTVGTTTYDIPIETATGTASQYQFFTIEFPFDAVSAGCAAVNAMAIRVRRLAASENEITGEFAVKGLGMVYTNKII